MASAYNCDVVVIGAGAIGLAIAKCLSERGLKVIIVEAAAEIASNTSRRNSGVIHSGIYYPQGSHRAKLCVAGKLALYQYCKEHQVPHARIGKLIVAKDSQQVEKLRAYLENGLKNGVNDLRWLSREEALAMEPELECQAAVYSPSTGIVDLKSLVEQYLADAKAHQAQLLLNSRVVAGQLSGALKFLTIKHTASGKLTKLQAKFIVNSAGLESWDVSQCLGIASSKIPRKFYAKGNYFALKGKPPFKHLVYPLPQQGGLGTHLTLDLQGGAKFGPDVEYIDKFDFSVTESKIADFEKEIREYWPGLPDKALKPAFAGIRPKLHGPGQAQGDWQIDSSLPGYIALYGVESPGITSSLAIGGYVADLVKPQSRL